MPEILTTRIPRHVAIIMDGNGRWATARGLPRSAGHKAGADVVQHIVTAAPAHGVRVLTLYAFSSENWKRPPEEVSTLMKLLERFLGSQVKRCLANGVRLTVIGRRDRLPASLVTRVAAAEAATAEGSTLHLRIAVDYSARQAILRAVALASGAPSEEEFTRLIERAYHQETETPPVDLLLRTGGEQRLSDFLLWESAYAELLFTETMWPDFTAEEFASVVDAFAHRERRFGAAPVVRT